MLRTTLALAALLLLVGCTGKHSSLAQAAVICAPDTIVQANVAATAGCDDGAGK